MLVYLDTSALLKLYIEEEGRELVREAVGAADTVATPTVAYAETRAGLARRFREEDFTEEEHRGAVADLDDDWLTYDRLNVSDLVSYLAGELAERHALRGYDALHLASAVRLSGRCMAAAANVGQEILKAEVVEVDRYGQHVKKKVFCGRFGNGTRQITDPTERERYQVQVWGP